MVKDSLRQRLGANLRAQRARWDLTQDELADLIGVTTRYLAGAERGERNWTLDTLDSVAELLGLDPVALLNGELADTLPPKRDKPADANPTRRKSPATS